MRRTKNTCTEEPSPLSSFSVYSFDAIPVLPFFSPFPRPLFLDLPSLDESVVMKDVNDDPLASLSSVPPPPRKTLSYSKQLLDPPPSSPSAAAKRNQVHNHSLDDNQFLHHQDLHQQPLSTQPHPAIAYHDYSFVDEDDDGYDDGFRPRSEVSAATPAPHPSSSDPHPLPEFVATGGNTGIFKLPVRSSVHSSRPVCVELRPHPLKETQVGKFLRNMAYADGQLWAGQECGVRYWNVERAYEPGGGLDGRIRRGDEDAAPFHESVSTPPTMCLVVDCASRFVWSGHKDGKIRSWRMDQGSDDTPFKEGLSWQAHRGAVLSMVMTSYGDIWTGFEGGVIKVWPWEAIEKSLSLSSEEKHMAALLVERSFVDLKSQVTVNGSCSISSSDVKCLLSDNVRAKVWAATPVSFSLWNTRTKELLKVFNIEGQMENRVDMPGNSEQAVEDETKAKLVSTSKKEKSQGSSFLQRSRNAIMGAADAVRRAATRGAGGFSEEIKKTEALLLSNDGRIWSGCSNGLLVQWDDNGNRLRDFNHHPCAVLCLCTFGTRIYVGYISGLVQVLDLEGNVIAGWIAHTGPVINMAVGDGQIYSLATHGGIRGWNITSPGPVDNIMRTELAKREVTFTRQSHVKILVGTWNVGQGKASQEALSSWLGSVASDVGIIVVGCQEVEMGAGFLAMSAAKESVGLEGSAIGNWWLDTIGKSLDEGNAFERMGSRQLAGLLIGLWVRKELRTHVGDVDIAAVACGFGRAIGNKGGVGLRIRVYDRLMCFVNCHLAAHLEAVNRRNADFDHIFRTMAFSKSYNVLNAAAAGVSSSAQMPRSTSNSSNSTEEGRPDLAEADMVVFLGDFNYRLFGISYDEARDFVSQRSFDWLREKDQLRAEMDEGRVFQGMREAVIKFPPTYKFERHQPGLGGYDSGEKKRIPAWCDRVIYRDNRPGTSIECGLDCPVVSSVLMYEACMDVTDSDHKPVRCKFGVQIAHTDRSVRREELGKIVRSNETINSVMVELRRVPNTVISIDDVILINQETCILKITNKCANDLAVFKFICQSRTAAKDNGQSSGHRPSGYFGFPRWLEVMPAAGVIKPEQSVEVSIRHEEHRTLEELVKGAPQYLGNEDTRDKEAILGLIVQGSCSTETRTHQIRVRHRSSSNTIHIDSKTQTPQVSMVPRSEPQQQFGDATNENGHVGAKHHP